MKIRDIDINKTVLSPMAGVTDLAFRLICKEMGVGLLVTEMVSSKGLYYKDRGTDWISQIDKRENPVSLQIFGSDPNIMVSVIKEDLNFRDEVDIIDINMGCPAPKIVKNGDGSALMKNPKLASEILTACVKASKKPVTLKIRSGWDKSNINGLEIAKIGQNSGIEAITVHGRTRDMFYAGQADWDIIGEIKSRLTIPVIGNGDIFEAEDALKMMEYTGCDGVAIGRGAMGNPFLFREINSLLAGEDYKKASHEEIMQTVLKHMSLACGFKGERVAIKEMRKHVAWYLKGLKNSNEVKNLVNTMDDKMEIEKLLKNYFKELQPV